MPPIASLRSLTYVLDEVQLFSHRGEREKAIQMLEKAGLGGDGKTSSRLNIGIKKLLSMIEWSRQDEDNIPNRFFSSLTGVDIDELNLR